MPGRPDSEFERELEARKRESFGQLLFKSARLLNERAIARLRETTGQPVRAAHTALLPHIDLEGTRLTELARRLGTTKQAAAELVSELLEMGLLERVPDPVDGRAKLIRFSRKGRAGLLQGLALLGQLEAEITHAIGERRAKALHEALTRIVDLLESAP